MDSETKSRGWMSRPLEGRYGVSVAVAIIALSRASAAGERSKDLGDAAAQAPAGLFDFVQWHRADAEAP